MSPPTLSLDDPACRDAGVAGAKAATLAACRQAGLPVPAGVVVPTAASARAREQASEALRLGGSGRARLAVMDVELDPALLDDLARRLELIGERFIVRSSATVESDGRWAGAFSSFADVGVAELATAIRGCWSSAYGVDALERAEAAGVDPGETQMAVLVQAQIEPLAGGVAEVDPGGVVTVDAVEGSPAPLLQGWAAGVRTVVSAEGTVSGALGPTPVASSQAVVIAGLARQVRRCAGHDRIEWALGRDGPFLLQAGGAGQPGGSPATGPDAGSPRAGAGARSHRAGESRGLVGPTALHAARLAQRYCGPLGERYVLPWALAADDGDARVPDLQPEAEEPGRAWEHVRSRAQRLVASVWGDAAEAGAVVRGLRDPDPTPALARIAAAPAPDADEVAAVRAGLTAVASHLVERRLLRRRSDLWLVDPQEIGGVLASTPARGPLPGQARKEAWMGWQPLLHAVIGANGSTTQGSAVVAGVGAGPVVRIREPANLADVGVDGCVVVVERPLPAVAPLLWSAAGLLVELDNVAAHLLEVASALGVPTVAGARLSEVLGGDPCDAPGTAPLALVDGYRGLAVVASQGSTRGAAHIGRTGGDVQA